MNRLLLFLLVLACSAAHVIADGAFLNVAILELPARYLADIPAENRTRFLIHLSQLHGDRRLDYGNGWLHYYNDNPYENPGATSQVYLKLLSRKDDDPLVFVFMPKQHSRPYILERTGKGWLDVRKHVLPRTVDLSMDFSPRRLSNVVEVVSFKRTKTGMGRHVCDLVWDGAQFQMREPKNSTPSDDD